MTTISWKVDADGSWGNAGAWSLGRLPNSADDAVIDTAHFHTVTHGSGTHTVHSLAVGNDDFVVSGGVLFIDATASFANRLTVSGGNLALKGAAATGSFEQFGGTVSGAGTLTVSGAANFSSTLLQTSAGRTVLEGASHLNGGAKFNLDGGRILENKGVFTLTGSASIHLGNNPFGLTLGGGTLKNDAGGVIDIQDGADIIADKGATGFTNAGTLQRTVGFDLAVIVPDFTNTGTVSVQVGQLEFSRAFINSGPGGVSVAAGAALYLFGGGSAAAAAFTVASGGFLSFGGPTFALGAGTIGGTTELSNGGGLEIGAVTRLGAFRQTGGTMSGAGTLTVTGPATFTSNLTHTGAGATVLKGASTMDGNVFRVDGGRILENQGTFTLTGSGVIALGNMGAGLGDGTLKNDAGGTIDIQGEYSIDATGGVTSFINAGTLKKTVGPGSANIYATFIDTGTVRIASGTLGFTGQGDSFAGLVSGAGTLAFQGGTHALNKGASLTVAHWSLSVGATASVNEDLGYAGGFTQGADTTLTVAGGDTLSLTGAASLAGTVNGAGTVELSNAFVSTLNLGGTATLSAVGAVAQAGAVTIGDTGSKAATLSIAAGATYALFGDSDIARGNSNKSSIQNSGLLIKSGGTATSVIAVKTTDTGVIEVASGTLDFAAALTGAGSVKIDAGATLRADQSVASTLTVRFLEGDGTLALAAPANFAATIHGFVSTDTIDLLNTAATSAKLRAGDTLVIKNGATTVATLQLGGDYAGAKFHVGSDSAGGTNITVTNVPVAGHRFIDAMAGLGDGHGPEPAWPEPRADAWRPMLSGPRMAQFA